MFNIVLVEPEIPANTGNIARTCAITGCSLHLVKPLGFSIDDKHLKRAGLDYWHLLDIHIYETLDEFLALHRDKTFYLATTKGARYYTEMAYKEGDFFLFGKETKGLSDDLRQSYQETCIKIPMLANPAARSLNLSNSVSVIIYEAFRQIGFKGLV